MTAGASSQTMKIEPLSVDFTDEQKRYLEGFTTGLQISRVGRGLGGGTAKANAEPTGPDAVHIKAQDKVFASGKKLVDQEKFKREEHPFDAYPRLRQQALDNAPPSPADNFRCSSSSCIWVLANLARSPVKGKAPEVAWSRSWRTR